jgi:hypothetical protein
LCGFGIFEDVDKAVAVLVPEMDAEVPILNFRDVLRHYVKINANEDEEDRISQLIFKWNEERLLEVHAKGERKSTTCLSFNLLNRQYNWRMAKQS